jgi:hypothetical protein
MRLMNKSSKGLERSRLNTKEAKKRLRYIERCTSFSSDNKFDYADLEAGLNLRQEKGYEFRWREKYRGWKEMAGLHASIHGKQGEGIGFWTRYPFP